MRVIQTVPHYVTSISDQADKMSAVTFRTCLLTTVKKPPLFDRACLLAVTWVRAVNRRTPEAHSALPDTLIAQHGATDSGVRTSSIIVYL